MLFLYNTAIRLSGLLIRLASLWNPKARQWVAGRNSIFRKLETSFAANTAPVVWFHCASLGEFEQARPLIEQLKSTEGNSKILLTFYSPSGYEIRKNYGHADWVFYLPLDTESNARRLVEIVKPTLVYFAKYEFWHHYLHQLKRQGIPVVLFSAIFRPGQLFFKPYGGFFRAMLRCFTHIFVQNAESERLLQGIGIQTVSVAGDTRIDRVIQIAAQAKAIPLAAQFKSGQPLLIIGSAWPGDTDLLVPFINRFSGPLKVILAPHEITENAIRQMEKTLQKRTVRYSSASETTVSEADVLIIDNIGMLGSLYQYGDFAYIGGGFIDGIHNILEPAVFGMPVFFGPNYRKFQEAHDLIGLRAAFPVRDTAEFAAAFGPFHADAELRRQAAQTSRDYIQQNAGATGKIVSLPVRQAGFKKPKPGINIL